MDSEIQDYYNMLGIPRKEGDYYHPRPAGHDSSYTLNDSNGNVYNNNSWEKTATVREERKESKDSAVSRSNDQYTPWSYPRELTDLFQPNECELCSVELTSPVVAKMHYSGKTHSKKVSRFLTEWCHKTGSPMPQVDSGTASSCVTIIEDYCELCDVTTKSLNERLLHYAGKTHQKNQKDPENSKRHKRSYETIDLARALIEDDPKKLKLEMASVFECELCDVKAVSQDQLMAHLSGKKHKEKLEKISLGSDIKTEPRPERRYKCDICKVALETKYLYNLHLQGKRHAKTLKQGTSKAHDFCVICNLSFTSLEQYEAHIQGRKHEKKSKQGLYKKITASAGERASITCQFCPYVGSEDHECDMSLTTLDFKDLEKKWVCPVCHNMVFDSEEAYNTHKNSRRHHLCVLNQEEGDKVVEEVKFFYCYLCKIQCYSGQEYTNHMFEEKHLRLASREANSVTKTDLFQCTVCDVIMDLEAKEEHMRGRKHLKLALKKDTMEIITELANKDITTTNLYCPHCAVTCSSFVKYSEHLLGDDHMDLVITKKLKMSKK